MFVKSKYKSKYQIILEYIFIILTILQCNSIYIYNSEMNIRSIVDFLWQVLLLFLIAFVFFNNNAGLSLFKDPYLIFSVCSFMVFYLIFFVSEFFLYPSFHKILILNIMVDPVLVIIYLSYYVNYLDSLTMIKEFSNIIVLLSFISLFFWIIRNLGISPTSSMTTFGWYSDNTPVTIPSYFNINFSPAGTTNLLGLDLSRNIGIFAEGSMYAYVLNISILMNLFLLNDKTVINKENVLLYCTLLSTASTTNIIFVTLALLYKGIFKKNKYSISKVITLFLGFISFVFIKYVFSNKINDISVSDWNSSYSIRIDDIRAGLETWKNHLIMGTGLGNQSVIDSHISSLRFAAGHTGMSAGFTTVLACGGIILGLFYIVPIICSFFVSSNIFGFSLFSLLPLIFVDVEYSYLCVFIIAYIWFLIFSKEYLISHNNETINDT